jgi:hypothetical protein
MEGRPGYASLRRLYDRKVAKGVCYISSVRQGEKRIATVELVDDGRSEKSRRTGSPVA